MKNKTCYISCPWKYSLNLKELTLFLEGNLNVNITSNGYGQEYDPSKLKDSDFVVFIFNDYENNIKISSLSRGILKELGECKEYNKTMYMAVKENNKILIKGVVSDFKKDIISSGKEVSKQTIIHNNDIVTKG